MPVNIPLHTTWQLRQTLRSLDNAKKNPRRSQAELQEIAAAEDDLLRNQILPQLISAIGETDETIPAPILIPARATYQILLKIKPDWGEGTTFPVFIKEGETVKRLKELVEVETEVEVGDQRLFFMGMEMKDGFKNLLQFGVQSGSVVEVRRRPL